MFGTISALPLTSVSSMKNIRMQIRRPALDYAYDVMYPADQITMPIYFHTNPDWATSQEEEITVSLLNEKMEVQSEMTLTMDQPLLTFSGKQEVWNGDHYVTFGIQNNAYVAGERPQIVLLPIYAEDEKNVGVDPENVFAHAHVGGTFSAGQGDLLSSINHSRVNYNLTVSLEDIWEENRDEDLLSASAYMVDENGKLLSDTKVTLMNPYYGVPEKEEEEVKPSKEEKK